MLAIITIIGFVNCEHKPKGTIATDIGTIQTNKGTMVVESGTMQSNNVAAMQTTIKENDITIETETEKEEDAQAKKPVNLGEFKLTAYCSCYLCCGQWALNRPVDEDGNEIVYGSIGERLQSGYSIAVDPTVIAYGTEVIINGHTYKAQDCGGAIKGNKIDIYFDSHQEALNFGVQYAEVFVVHK